MERESKHKMTMAEAQEIVEEEKVKRYIRLLHVGYIISLLFASMHFWLGQGDESAFFVPTFCAIGVIVLTRKGMRDVATYMLVWPLILVVGVVIFYTVSPWMGRLILFIGVLSVAVPFTWAMLACVEDVDGESPWHAMPFLLGTIFCVFGTSLTDDSTFRMLWLFGTLACFMRYMGYIQYCQTLTMHREMQSDVENRTRIAKQIVGRHKWDE